MTGARRWIVLLAACAATFAATTIYLWRELAQERAPQPRVVLANPPPALPGARAPVTVSSADAVPGMRAVLRSPDPHQPDPNVDPVEYQRQQSRQLLEQLANPAARARLLEESKLNYRNAYPWVAERLKLSPEEYQQLIDTLARADLELREAYARCEADPDCDIAEFASTNRQLRTSPVADLLGPERMKEFESYQSSINERETVLNLRGRLPDQAHLSTEQAEALISALADETGKAQREAGAAGHGMAGFSLNGGSIWYVDRGTPEQRIQSAEAYLNRTNARAAQVLTSEQLRYFTQIQQDLLANLRVQLERPDREK